MADDISDFINRVQLAIKFHYGTAPFMQNLRKPVKAFRVGNVSHFSQPKLITGAELLRLLHNPPGSSSSAFLQRRIHCLHLAATCRGPTLSSEEPPATLLRGHVQMNASKTLSGRRARLYFSHHRLSPVKLQHRGSGYRNKSREIRERRGYSLQLLYCQ